MRLAAERINLQYALEHAELTEEQRILVKRRLITVETELLDLFAVDTREKSQNLFA